MNPNKPTSRHIIITVATVISKERIIKAGRERQSVTYKGTTMILSADFITETF